MDYRIYKYELEVTDWQLVDMPEDAEILSVHNQNGNLCLWALVDKDKDLTSRAIEIFGTGQAVPQDMGVGRTFIGTVLSGPFVWHVFERI